MYVTSPYATQDAAISNAANRAFTDAACSDDRASASATTGATRAFAAKAHLFCEGDEAGYLYEVVSGVVRSTKLLADGRRQVVAFGYPGDIVGICADGVYHHDCEAVCDTEVRAIPTASLAGDPALVMRMMRSAAAEVTGMQDHFIMLGRKCALEKVASFLVSLMQRAAPLDEPCRVKGRTGDVDGAVCFDLPMSRCDIADFLGLTIETVSRTLTRLRKAKVIVLPQPHRVCIVSPEALRRMAERDE